MIRNILFDMGGVLIRFEPDHFIRRLNVSDEDARLLNLEVFRSLEWGMMDWGAMDEAEAACSMCTRLPSHLHQAVQTLVCQWDDPILPMEGMERLLERLSGSGYRLFLLSNASRRQHEYWPSIPGHQYMKDTLISADAGLVKPQPEIFRLACEKFDILPEESIFVDDLPLNTAGAQRIGMKSFVFHGDASELEQWLKAQGLLF